MGQENSLLQKLDFVWLKLHVTEIEATGSVERRQGSGTKRTVSTRGNIESVQEQNWFLDKILRPGTHRPVREMARETDQDNQSHRVSVFRTQHWNLRFSLPNIRQ